MGLFCFCQADNMFASIFVIRVKKLEDVLFLY